MEKTWENINKVLNRNYNKFSPETLTIDYQICTDKIRMAKHFNTYFTTICTSDVPIISNYPSFKTYLNNPQNKIFSVINNDFTLQIISKLKPPHSSGYDSISINPLKIILREISPCTTLIEILLVWYIPE